MWISFFFYNSSKQKLKNKRRMWYVGQGTILFLMHIWAALNKLIYKFKRSFFFMCARILRCFLGKRNFLFCRNLWRLAFVKTVIVKNDVEYRYSLHTSGELNTFRLGVTIRKSNISVRADKVVRIKPASYQANVR